eukprot:m.389594 g.389594  ORF g.389594 m.389594 type:complete len:54 (+) comp180942_c0_seq1:88-249(+)
MSVMCGCSLVTMRGNSLCMVQAPQHATTSQTRVYQTHEHVFIVHHITASFLIQ